MAPLIVTWPGGIFPTANTVVKGGARKSRKGASKSRKGRKSRKQKTRHAKTMKSRRRS